MHSLFFCLFVLVSEEFPEVLKVVEVLALFSFIPHMSEFPPTRPAAECLVVNVLVFPNYLCTHKLWLYVGGCDPFWHVGLPER